MEGVLIVGADVPAVHEDVPLGGIVEPHQQVDDGGFAAAGGADDAEAAALWDGKVDIRQAGLPMGACKSIASCLGAAATVAEADVVKADEAVIRGLRGPGFRNGSQLLVSFHHCGNAVGGGVGLGHEHEDAVDAHGAVEDHVEIGEEGQNHARLGDTAVDPACADDHHQRQPHVQEEGHDGAGQGHDDAGLFLIVGQLFVGDGEPRCLVRLLG